ncbi:MAG: hypothetical protein ACRDFQ_08115 [Anaerolineales bacterium]
MSKSAGALSGCLLWGIAFGLLSICICPASMFVAGIIPVTHPRQVEDLVDPILCPAGSQATITHYNTTVRDFDTGVDRPGVGYEMHCIGPNGEAVRSFEGTFGIALIGILGAAGLLVAAALAFVLAAPVGVLIAKFFPKKAS